MKNREIPPSQRWTPMASDLPRRLRMEEKGSWLTRLFSWRRNPPMRRLNVSNFLSELATIARPAELGAYAFANELGECRGFVQFIPGSDRQLIIHRLWTLNPGKGNGTAMLRALCGLADRHDVELSLKPLPIGRKPYSLSRLELSHWYQRHGFEPLRGKILGKLIRKPITSSSMTTFQVSRLHLD